MKGLIFIALILLSIGASASQTKPGNLYGIKVASGEVLKNLTLRESTKVLKALSENENIEIREKIIYPEQITSLIVSELTKYKLIEKSPNPQDYN
jgi:hypothetical protein